VVANLETRFPSCLKWGRRQFRVGLRPAEIPASREPGLRLNPQLRRIPAEMRAELTGAEIAMRPSNARWLSGNQTADELSPAVDFEPVESPLFFQPDVTPGIGLRLRHVRRYLGVAR
jgi:hypothetical protein